MEKPKNLQQAVQQQLEKRGIHEVWNVTGKFQQETNFTQARLAEATLEAFRELGVKKVPDGDLLISSYLEQKGKTDTFKGKEI